MDRSHYLRFRVKKWWIDLKSSLWFIPTLLVLTSAGAAVFFIWVDTVIPGGQLRQHGFLFGASADGSRSLLTAIAGSMITVAGVTFSITIVTLSLAANAYTPRILRNFMRDPGNQLVLGSFVGIFVYCLLVLRTIRGGEEPFVPSISVLFAIVLALAGVGFLIYFIHHISMSIQASTIIAAINDETRSTIETLYPDRMSPEAERQEAEDGAPDAADGMSEGVWQMLPSIATGYIQNIEEDALFDYAVSRGAVLRMERGVGEFVIKGTPLVSIRKDSPWNPDEAHSVLRLYAIDRYRTVERDVSFGIRQIVDAALKALSPGVNDATTAVTCIDYLGSIFCLLADRRLPGERRCSNGTLRLIRRPDSFKWLLDEGFHQIRRNASGNVAVMLRILSALEVIGSCCREASSRRRLLWEHAELIRDASNRTVPSAHDRDIVERHLRKLKQSLDINAMNPLTKDLQMLP